MSPKKKDADVWLRTDEFPTERDIDAFGDDAPYDDDPLTIGQVGRGGPRRLWTGKQLIIAGVLLVLLAALVLPELLPALWPLR